MNEDIYVIADGKALITLKGLLEPGQEVTKEDLKCPENFDALLKKGIIINKVKYKDNDESKYRAPTKTEDNKKDKKTMTPKKDSEKDSEKDNGSPMTGAKKR